MIRVSKQQLAERWALTYSQDGYQVRAQGVPGRPAPADISGVKPDIEATRDGERVLVHIIPSPESLEDGEIEHELHTLSDARSAETQLHVIVAAECARDIKERLDHWQVHADAVHVT